MRTPALLLLLSLTLAGGRLAAQQVPTATTTTSTPSDAHAAAVQLVEASGMRQQLIDHKEDSIKAGQEAIRKAAPNVNPAFVDEWGKRMLARYNPDDYVAVAVRVYEAHFTNDELHQLLQAQLDVKASRPANLSPELKSKLTESVPAIQSEIIGGCTQIGSKTGAEIGQQLQTEHPVWFPDSAPASPRP